MPNLDLRDIADKSQFDPLAHFKLLSVMLHPNDGTARERVLSSIRAENKLSGQRRRPLTLEESKIAQQFGATRGGEAGFMMMALIQLHTHGIRPTLGKAVDLIRMELPGFGEAEKLTWAPEKSHLHLPRHVGKLRNIFQQFGSVAHFWAAFVHEQQWNEWRASQGQEERGDPLPTSISRLPRFLAMADEIWNLYSQLPIRGGSSPDKAHIPNRCNVTVPVGAVESADFIPMVIPDDRLADLTR